MRYSGGSTIARWPIMGKRGSKHDKTGRTNSGDKWIKWFLCTMQTPAWRALSPYAQRLYPWLRMEWDGPKSNNNGSIKLSVKQAAKCLGCNRETARRAFLDLQAKGFLVVTRRAALGSHGKARSHLYEITEIGTVILPKPRNLYRDWKPGHDFEVKMANANNPTGIGGVKNSKSQLTDGASKGRINLESQLTDGALNGRPQLTDGACPNLPDRSNGAKNSHFPTYGVSHPYTPGGTGGHGGAAGDSVGNPPAKPAKPSPENPESKPVSSWSKSESESESDFGSEFGGIPRGLTRFAVVRDGVVTRVGVRTLRRGPRERPQHEPWHWTHATGDPEAPAA